MGKAKVQGQSGCQELGVEGEADYKGTGGNLGGDQTVPYLDCGGGGFMIMCIRQNSKKCTLKEG